MQQSASSNHRRHSDPPLLWASVLAGSLLLNTSFTIAFQQYLEQANPAPPTLAPIAVDIFPVTPSNRPAPQLPAFSPPARVAPTPAAQSPQKPVARSTVTLASSARPKPSLQSQRQPPQSATTQQPPRLTDTSPPKSATSPAHPPSDNAPLPQTTPSTPATTNQSPIGTGTGSEVATSGVFLPGFTPPPDPKTNSGTKTEQTLDSFQLDPNSLPARFIVRVQVIDAGRDRSPETTSVTLKSEPFTKTFTSGDAGCFLTPDVAPNFNQPLRFHLTLNPKGQVIEAVPLDANPSPAYQNLATCALQTWTFDPATAIASTSPAAISRSLTVNVILTK